MEQIINITASTFYVLGSIPQNIMYIKCYQTDNGKYSTEILSSKQVMFTKLRELLNEWIPH